MEKTKKKVIDYVKEYYNLIEGEEWWRDVENVLRVDYGYPNVYFIEGSPLESMLRDFHKIFRPLIITIAPPTGETSLTRLIVAKGRSSLLKARVPPHYVGLRCPAYQSRSRNNFGVIGMVPDEEYGKGVFSRAVLNVPFFWKEKLKRLVLGCYGLTKHGKSISEINDFPQGGIFLLNPDSDEPFDRLTPYRDYSYVALKVRLPKDYREYIQTLDGSVLISRSAAEKLRYRKVAKVLVRNPVESIREKHLLWKKGVKKGAEVKFQEALSVARIGKEELAINTSPVEGVVDDYELLTPNVPEERRIYRLTLVGERNAELGDKLESATGLKNTVGGFVPDSEPVIVINPDTLKDRSLYWEIKETGKAHVYITLTGRDGNISNKNARISNTLIQGIFTFPEKVRKELVEEMFSPDNLVLNAPSNILDIIENFDINPKKYPIFYPQLYYIRQIKKWRVAYNENGKEKSRLFTDKKKAEDFASKTGGKIREYVYYNEQLSQFGRAVESLFKEVKKITKNIPLSALPKPLRRKIIDAAYDRVPNFYKNALDRWVQSWASRLIIGDPGKSCQIKLKGWMRIVLFDSKLKVNEIKMGKELWETMGKPEYVIWYKEPVSRPESIRCLKVVRDRELDNYPQVVRIHPALGMNYDDGSMRAKVDTDGDLAVLIPVKKCIKGLQYNFKREDYKTVKENLKKYREFSDLPEPEYDYTTEELAKELTCYNRYLTQEAQVIEWFGGLKNRAMYTDLINDHKKWLEFTKEWDIELKGMQAEKFIEGFKEMDYCQKAEVLRDFLTQARKEMSNLPPRDPFAEEWLNLSRTITFKDRYKIREYIKKLKKQKHPVLKLYWYIYQNSPLKI